MHGFRQKGESPAEHKKTKRRRDSHLLENSSVTIPDLSTCTKMAKTLARRAKTVLAQIHCLGKKLAYK